MKHIKLTQGKFALVSNEDFNWLNQWKWHAHKGHHTFYAKRENKKRTILMHRLILGLKERDGFKTDHRDGNGLNNQRNNLRNCSHIQNLMNRPKQSNNTAGFKGVAWYKKSHQWEAKISRNHIKYHLGYYSNKIKAAKAYDQKAKELYGEFAYLNFRK